MSTPAKKEDKSKHDAGAAAPTADDSADKPDIDVINVGPQPEGHDVPDPDNDESAGYVNTTQNADERGTSDKPRTRDLTEKDKQNIVKEFNGPGAVVDEIAIKYDLSSGEVMAIADEANQERT